MPKRKSTKSLHIQNDQTDDAGVYQRNRGADLFMESPGGIQQFTNFDAKVTSYNNSGNEVRAGLFDSPYRWMDTSRQFEPSSHMPFEYENGKYFPSDIKILDNLAIVSYKEHSQKVYIVNQEVTEGYVIIKVTYDKVGEDEVFNDVDLNSGLVIPNLGTAARNLTEFTGDNDTPGTNSGIDAGYSITPTGDVAVGLGIACVESEIGEGCDLLGGDVWIWSGGTWTQQSFTGCGACLDPASSTNCGCDSLPPANPGSTDGEGGTGTCRNKTATVCDPFVDDGTSIDKKVNEGVDEFCAGQAMLPMPADALENKDGGIFFSQVKNKKGEIVDVLQGLVVDFTTRSIPSDAHLLSLRTGGGSSLIWVDECSEDTVTYYYRVPCPVVDSYYWQIGQKTQCGRVDIFERRSGTITAVAGNKVTVTGPTGDGEFDINLLNDYDRIKIVSGVNETPKDHPHPINGIKYIKRLPDTLNSETGEYDVPVDNQYYIYDDVNLTMETETSSLRGTDGLLWAFHPDNSDSVGVWRYKQTLFSPHGLNGDGIVDRGATPYVDERGVTKLSGYGGGYNGLQDIEKVSDIRNAMHLMAWGYRFGQAIDIIKQPGTNYYWLAISELGNTCDSSSGMSYFGEIHAVKGISFRSSSRSTLVVDENGDAVVPMRYINHGIGLQEAIDFGLDPRTPGLGSMFINHTTGEYEQIDWNNIENYSYGGYGNPNPPADQGVQTIVLSPFGYQAKAPVHPGYGKVWLYKVTTNNSSDSHAIYPPEEINAGTRNGRVSEPPEMGGHSTKATNRSLDTKKYSMFASVENLYWFRAWISNLKSGGFGTRRSSFGTSDTWNYNSGYPLKWSPSWSSKVDDDGNEEDTDEYGNPGGFDSGMDIELPDGGTMGGMMGGTGGGAPSAGGGDMGDGGGMGGGGGAVGDAPLLRGGSTNLTCIKSQVFPVGLTTYQEEFNRMFGEHGVGSVNFFRENILSFYRTNESPFAPYMTSASALTNGYRFADGFGFNICMKVDDITNGNKPIIAIANTVFPYLPTISKAATAALESMQKDLDRLKRKGYEDANTQDFIDRHTKTNEFITDFLSDGSGEAIDLGSMARNGSIFIHNCNQKVNTQELDHTLRVSRRDILGEDPRKGWMIKKYSKNYFYEYNYWYSDAPSMMFDNGSLLVGTDEGRIKVFKEGSLSTHRYQDQKMLGYSTLFSRFATVDGVDYLLPENPVLPLTIPVEGSGYKYFTDEEKKHYIHGTRRGGIFPKDGSFGGSVDYIDTWVWNASPHFRGGGNRQPATSDRIPMITEDDKPADYVSVYRNYSHYYINPTSDILTTPIMPVSSSGGRYIKIISKENHSAYTIENQKDPRVLLKDERNILLGQPFGYLFRCDNGLLVAHGASYTNEFDVVGDNLAHRLYLYEMNKNGFFDFFQKITPATSNMANGTIPGDGIQNESYRVWHSRVIHIPKESVPNYVNIFPEGSMTVEEKREESRTIAYLMKNTYDVLSGVVVLMTPYGNAVFSDSGASKSYDFIGDHRSSQVSPYLSFTEEFNAKNPYNLNNMYSYREGLGIDYPANIYDINDEHSGLCAFYNIETNSSQYNSIRILKSVKFTVDVEENVTLKGADDADVAQVLPILTFYKDDPRKTITQTGVTDVIGGGSKLLYGSNSSNSYDSPSNPLYADGLQDSAVLVKYPTYNRTSVAGDQGWRGIVTIDGPEISVFAANGSLIKSSSDNKTILYNDGNGYTDGSYSQTFDDVNKASFDSRAQVESTLVVGLMSHNIPQPASDFDGIYRTKWVAGREGTGTWGQELNYIPYSKPFDISSNAHSFINKAKISSVQLAYKDYDLGDIRRFRCATFRESQHRPPFISPLGFSQPGTEGFLRMGRSKTPALFDIEGIVLGGTNSESIQIVEANNYNYWESSYTNYISDNSSHASDIQKPEFLSLSIYSAPQDSKNFTLSMDGHLTSSELIPTYIAGVASHSDSMPLKIGSTPVVNYLGLSLPVPLGFRCGGTSLFTPTAFGTSIVSGMSAQFPGGTGVNKGVSLAMGMPHNSGGMKLAMGQAALGSGNMNVAMSGVYGSYNSIPCIEGNLYLNATYVDNGNMPLNLGRLSDSGNMPLSLRTADPASGVMNLAINTEPFNSNNTSYPSGVPLHYKGYIGDTANTNLYIGEQASAGSAPLFLMQPHRIPFIDPQSPATYEGDDTSQIPTLYVSGAAVPTANSLDDNFQHQKQMVRENSQLDYSSNAEAIISYNSSNSLSRNAFIPNGSHDYGVKRISKVGSSLENYNGLGTVSFYNNEMSRQAIDSNGTYLAVGTNSNVLSSNPPLQIFNTLDESSVKLAYTYTEFKEDLVDLGISDAGQIMFYYKDVKISSENKIAVSVRAQFNEYISDIIFILEEKAFDRLSTIKTDFDECAIKPQKRLKISIDSFKRWKITSVFTSSSWQKTTSADKILNRVMGESISWKGEDLYYGKQSTRFANVYARYESDDYATENKAFGFGDTSDATNYNKNINNIPAGTKTGFGAKIQLAGDFAFVSAPLLDPYIANNTLSAVNAASPDGAVYIFKYDSGWSYVDAIYSGGLISSAIAGVDSCAYDAKLFGYDLDYDSKSGYLSVGEPMSNTVYQFNINAAGTPSLLNSYSSTDSKFGTFVNSVSAGLITNTKSKIQDVVYSQDFEFSVEEIESEILQYISEVNVINSVSHEIVSVQKATLAGKEKLLVVRDFEVDYGAGKVKKIQKISLLSLHDINGTLYISGPSPVSDPINLSVLSPSGGATGDLGITFGSIGTGIAMPLHLTNYIGSGEAPLYMRGPLQRPHTLYMSAELTPVASGASLVTAGPVYASNASDLSIEGKAVRDLSSSIFVLGGVETGAMAQMGVPMRVAQVDLYPVSGQQDALITGIGHGTGNITGSPSLWLGAGDYGPASGTTFMRMEAPLSEDTSASTSLRMTTDPASGVFETVATLMMPNTQTVDVNGRILKASQSLRIAAIATNSEFVSLRLHRQGIGGGSEVEANTSLMMTSVMSTSDINVYMSGGNISTNTVSLAIPSSLSLPSGNLDLFMRGYSE
jgi:hypothetical protein